MHDGQQNGHAKRHLFRRHKRDACKEERGAEQRLDKEKTATGDYWLIKRSCVHDGNHPTDWPGLID